MGFDGVSFCFDWEVRLIEFLQDHMGSILTWAAKIATLFGEEVVMIALLGFLYWCFDKELAKHMGLGMVIGIVVAPVFKNLMHRNRPYIDHDKIKCLKTAFKGDPYDVVTQGYSFPSGHSVNSTVMYGGIFFGNRRKWVNFLGFLLPFLIGVSRFALGVHYPTDVMAGWMIGLIILGVLHLLRKCVKTQWKLHLGIFVLACMGLFFCRTADYFTGLGVMAGFFLAVPFEEKFVRFDNTRKVWKWMVRLVLGFALYFGVNMLLKLPFSESFLDSTKLLAFLVRFVRYLIVTFLLLGVYPMVFRREKM